MCMKSVYVHVESSTMHIYVLCAHELAAVFSSHRSRERHREQPLPEETKPHVSKRRKQSPWWDVAPRGFEHISPLQFKAMQGVRVCVCVCAWLCDIQYAFRKVVHWLNLLYSCLQLLVKYLLLERHLQVC